MEKRDFKINIRHVIENDSINIEIEGERIGCHLELYYDDTDNSQIIRVRKTSKIMADKTRGFGERTEWLDGFMLPDDLAYEDGGEL